MGWAASGPRSGYWTLSQLESTIQTGYSIHMLPTQATLSKIYRSIHRMAARPWLSSCDFGERQPPMLRRFSLGLAVHVLCGPDYLL
jgi:hypothetical protein